MIKNMDSVSLNTELKRWTIYDCITEKFYDVSDYAFNEGIQNKAIKLTGKFMKVENKHNIWVDGIVVK